MSGSIGEGLDADLERSCAGDWMATAPPAEGIERLDACLTGRAYAPHRHDSYAVGITLAGVHGFGYRGESRASAAGRVLALYPDELHDGRALGAARFRNRMLYIEPSLISEALDGASPPFLADPVSADPRLTGAVAAALADLDQPLDDLRRDAILSSVAQALEAAAGGPPRRRSAIDRPAVARARELLIAEAARTVRREELERVSGLDRWRLTRQFRAICGVSPHRFQTMRRLERVRAEILAGAALAEAALTAGFADQSHMTRQFARAYGLSPGRWRRLARAGARADGSKIGGGFLPPRVL